MGVWGVSRARSNLPDSTGLGMAYSIPAQTVRDEITVRKSRFVAFAAFADSPESAKAFLDSVRAEMPDASHYVYAFRAGYGNTVIEGVSDDGEPSGTSGPPILSILRGTDIGDIIVVVVRYFGGTKLGTGGLVRAYSDAAKLVLEQMPITPKIKRVRFTIELPYALYESVKRLILEADGKVTDETFAAVVQVSFAVPEAKVDELKVSIRNATSGQVTLP